MPPTSPIAPRIAALFEALCCVMAVDGRISKSERKVIAEILTKIKAPVTDEQIEASFGAFIARVKNEGISSVIDASIERLKASSGNPSDRRVYLQSLLMVANADGKVDRREENLITRYRNALVNVDTQAEIAQTNLCPSCQTEHQQNAVLCISCGYNFQKQQHVATEFGEAVEDGWKGFSFSGRRFSINKHDADLPMLVLERRLFWFKRRYRQYNLTLYREISTSSRDIKRRQESTNDEVVVGESLRLHLRPHHEGKEREIVFSFDGYYSLFGLPTPGRQSYTVARDKWSNLIDLIRGAHRLPLLPRY